MNPSISKYKFRQGTMPLLVSMPHVGTHIPPDIAAGMTAAALQLPDTDWHLEQLYDFLDEFGASALVATHSRYVIDLNRARDESNLYPGLDTTGLCPIDTFHKEPLYQAGKAPDEEGIQQRCSEYWNPYHAALADELQRIRAEHGIAMLWLGGAALFRRSIAGPEPRHRWRHFLRIWPGGTAAGNRRIGDRLQRCVEWTIQGRIYHAQLWQAGRQRSCRAA